jgi:hypothetical protein
VCQRLREKRKGGGELGRCGRERDGPVGFCGLKGEKVRVFFFSLFFFKHK